MKTRASVILAVTTCLVGFGAGLVVGSPGRDAGPAEGDEQIATNGGTDVPLGDEYQLLANARRALAEERARREEAEAKLAALETPGTRDASRDESSTPAAGEAATEAEATRAKGARYVYPGLEKAITNFDWRAAGDAAVKLLPHIEDLVEALAAGKEPPASVGRIQRYNGVLLEMALQAKRDGMPGTGINGAFSHPVTMVNLVHAALEADGLPLDEDQQEKLGTIGDRYLQDDRRRLAGYGEETLLLEKIIGENALKDRFWAEVDALLTEAQRNVLHPEPLRGRLGVDVFSSGVLWNPLAQPVWFEGREDLATSMAAALAKHFALGADAHPMLQDLSTHWAQGFSNEYLRAADDPLARASMKLSGGLTAGWLETDQARIAARHQLALFRALLQQLPADSPAVAKIRGAHRVAIPVKKAAD